MKLKLVEIHTEVEGVKSFYFRPSQPISWLPGQYMHYRLPHPHQDDRGVERYFTISAAPFEKHISITTRFNSQRSSTFKEALFSLPAGVEVESDGPRGQFTIQEGDYRHILIAGGIGITPYRSMLAQMDHDGLKIDAKLLYANSDKNLVFGKELNEIAARNPRFSIKTYIGETRISESELKEYLADNRSIFYLSGPKAMVENYQHTLETLGASEEKIKTDYFPGY